MHNDSLTSINIRRLVTCVGAVVLSIAAQGCRSSKPPVLPPSPAVSPATAKLSAGDQVVLVVEGDTTLSKTFTVREGVLIDLPTIGPISLAGVPRAQIESHMNTQLAKYLRKPTVRARALVRIGVLGEVAHPGFYTVSPETGIADALAQAGGVTQLARIDALTINRNGMIQTDEEPARRALAAGTSIDQLGMVSGDQVVVPLRKDPERNLRVIGVMAAIPAALLSIALLAR
jgi:protein involved in polysaccharide export with SLBB domain